MANLGSGLRASPPGSGSAVAHRYLALAGKIDGLAENPRRLLRRVEAGRVLRLHEIEIELCFALEVLRCRKILVAFSRALGSLQVLDQIHQRVHRHVAQRERALLDVLDARLELLFGPLVAGLTGAVDIEHRAPHAVVTDLERAFALVSHMAVRAGPARARVNALIPQLEFRVLRLEDGRARVRVRPILELRLVVVRLDLLDLYSLGPRVDQPLLGPFEIIFDVALPADVRAHFLARRVPVDVVVLHALRSLQRLDALDEAGTRNPELHRRQSRVPTT